MIKFPLTYTRTHPILSKYEGPFALEVHDLSVEYPSIEHTLALYSINLSVKTGSRIALVGPNGAGKSTLLKAVVGLLKIKAGDIKVFGNPVGTYPSRIAYLPQRGEIDWHFPITLRKLVITGRYVQLGWFKRPNQLDYEIADNMIDRMGLSALKMRQIGELSGGQQQRALLARALAQNADLLLLDEPLNAVDAQNRAVIAEVLNQLYKEGRTVISATHDLGRLETDYDAAVYLSEGREVAPPPGAFGVKPSTIFRNPLLTQHNGQKVG